MAGSAYSSPTLTGREWENPGMSRRSILRVAPGRGWKTISLGTCALQLALFIFTTNAGYLTPGMLAHAEGASSMIASSQGQGFLHDGQLSLALFITLIMVLARWRSVATAAQQMIFFSASALVALASFLWSQDPAVSLRSSIYLCLNTLFAYYLAQRFSTEELKRIVMLLGVVIAAVSTATAVALPHYAWTAAGSRLALQGAFVAKNALGNAAVLLLTPVFFVRTVSKGKRAAYAAILLVLIGLSFSLQAWICAAFCFLFAGCATLYRRLRLRDVAWIGYVTVIPLLALAVFAAAYWVDILQFFGKDPTLTGRTTIWAAVLESVYKRPILGWGYNAFWRGFQGESASVILAAHWGVGQAQNGALEVLLGVGAVGLTLVLATMVQAVRNAWLCIRYGDLDSVFWYLLVFSLTIIYSFGEAILQVQNSLTWILYIVVCTGLAIEARSIRQKLRGKEPVPSRSEGVALAAQPAEPR